jgi:hypothetical protein
VGDIGFKSYHNGDLCHECIYSRRGRIINFNEWLCICFVGKHGSLGQMSSSFLGSLGANQPKFLVPWGKWPQILKSNTFSQGKWVQNMVLQGNPNSLGKHGFSEQICPTSFEPSWFGHRKLPRETWLSASFPLEARETWLSPLILKEVASSCFSKATCSRKLSKDYILLFNCS